MSGDRDAAAAHPLSVSGDRDAAAAHPLGACAECGSPLCSDQRYCLGCGARRGPRPPALERILEGLGADANAPAVSSPERAAPGWWVGGLPKPRTAAVLTLVMLAFGTVTGAAARNPSGALNALRRGPLTLLIPTPAKSVPLAAVPPPAEATSTPAVAPSSSSEESPSSNEESGSSSEGVHKNSGKGGSKGSAGVTPKLPPVKHVFLIVLANQAYAQTFGPESPAPYIAHTLEHRGELLARFYAVAHEELADEVALISGLAPTPQTGADCPVFTDIVPGAANSKGQYTGQGCIYPTEAQTVGEQLAAKGLTWKVYAEGIKAACWHPEFGAADPTSAAPGGDTFATFRDPFTYFDGVLHSPACTHDDVGIEGLTSDLKSAKRTPAFSYIAPGLCHDGRPTPCAPGAPSGLPAAETFLRRVVPEILASPAYRKGGLLIITTDQAPTTGEYADSSSCCVQPRFPAPIAQPTVPTGMPTVTTPTTPGATSPATTSPTTTVSATATPTTTTPTTTSTSPNLTPATATPTTPAATTPITTSPGASTTTTTTPVATTPSAPAPGVKLPPPGGGQVGALLLSPFIKPGTFDQEESFNDFSLLRTIENLFGLPPLGYAATRGLSSLEASVFSAWTPTAANSP